MNYDIIKYDAGDIRNKSVIDEITKHNMSDKNIMSIFNKKIKKIAIIMDEIDGMNNGDKGGINTLIKLIRPKKTKKQKLEEITMNPIVCIGNYKVDKKISEITQQHICDRCILSNQFAIFFFYDHLNSRPDCQPLVPEMMSLPKFSSNIAMLH